MKIDVIIVEGLQIARGSIAAMCAKIAMPQARILGLSLEAPFASFSVDEIVVAPAVEEFSTRFEALLVENPGALVIPSSIYGTVIANRFRNSHKVLANQRLHMPKDEDKIYLRSGQPDLEHLLVPLVNADGHQFEYPLLAKPRIGHSSNGHYVLESHEQLKSLHRRTEYFFERYYLNCGDEFSITVVNSGATLKWGCIRRVAQAGGQTTISERVAPDVPWLTEIATKIVCNGIFNIQFIRTRSGEIMIYDLNPRFGKSELFRSCFGFNFVSAFLGNESTPLTTALKLSESEAIRLLKEACEMKK